MSICPSILNVCVSIPNPDTKVCSHNVHESKPSQTLELVNIQLKIEIIYIIWIFCCCIKSPRKMGIDVTAFSPPIQLTS